MDSHTGSVLSAATESEVRVADLDAGNVHVPVTLAINVEESNVSKTTDTDELSLVGVSLTTSVNVVNVNEVSVSSGHGVTLEIGRVDSVGGEWPSVVSQGVVGWGHDQVGRGDDDVLGDEESTSVSVDCEQVGEVCETFNTEGESSGIS